MDTQQSSEVQEFSNETLKVKVHRKPQCKIELEVETTPAIVEKARQAAAKIVGKEVTIAGFRKGKAPAALVEKKYSKQIDTEWEKAIANAVLPEALKLVQIPILNNEMKIGYNVKSCSLTEGSKLILFFETEPTVPTIDPKEIVLKTVERPAVNEEKVSETIRQLQLFFAEWTPIQDRGVQEGDFVILDVDIIEEEPKRKLFSDVRFEVTNRSMAKWMKELILGHHTHEALEGTSVPDETASQEDQENLKPQRVRVVIKKIETTTLPELTDAFAQNIGAPSVEEMRKNIEALLNQKADAHVREKEREAVSEILLTKYPFDIPSSIIDREVRFRLEQLTQDPEYLKHWNSMTPEAKKRTVGAIGEQSQKAVRMFYLCRKIVTDAKIPISPKDLPKVPKTPLNLLLGQSRPEDAQAEEEVHPAAAYSRLLLEKAEDYIIAHAARS